MKDPVHFCADDTERIDRNDISFPLGWKERSKSKESTMLEGNSKDISAET